MSDNQYCENTMIDGSKEYKLEKVWRSKKTDKSKDSKGEHFPFPKEGKTWPDRPVIIGRLIDFGYLLDQKKRYDAYDRPKDCLLCDVRNVTTKKYKYANFMWDDGLVHYVERHNIEPSTQFKEFLLNGATTQLLNRSLSAYKPHKERKGKVKKVKKKKMILSRVIKNEHEYVMVNRNQMLILDALMIHGGYAKKYIDLQNNFSRYSEHAGFLEFENNSLSKIVVSGKTTRVDEGDEDIYLPMDMEDMFDYEYIFHTHPPTPRPGGRAKDGILYEFPSTGDLYHFIDHHNGGNVIGSLIVTAEGLYNIHKFSSDSSNISIDDNELFKKYERIFDKVQEESIKKYGAKFDTKTFYSVISQDLTYVSQLNTVLNKFDLQIDFYPRKKDKNGHWVIDTVFLVFRQNKVKK
jgi:hypothetical protein